MPIKKVLKSSLSHYFYIGKRESSDFYILTIFQPKLKDSKDITYYMHLITYLKKVRFGSTSRSITIKYVPLTQDHLFVSHK